MLENWQQYMDGVGTKATVDSAWIAIWSYIARTLIRLKTSDTPLSPDLPGDCSGWFGL